MVHYRTFHSVFTDLIISDSLDLISLLIFRRACACSAVKTLCRVKVDAGADNSMYMCAADARQQYKLTENDLSALHFKTTTNVYSPKAPPMKLYLVGQLRVSSSGYLIHLIIILLDLLQLAEIVAIVYTCMHRNR
jgi:hypothetical protein